MPIRLDATPTFAGRLRSADRTLYGMWSCAGSPLVAEICAGSGLDILLIDGEHSPVGLESILAQLQAAAAYPVVPVVRAPIGDAVILKQLLDLGAQNVLVPMMSSVLEAEEMVRAVRYPPLGIRGVGSALARSSRWSRIPDYLARAHELVSLTVQIETVQGLKAARSIAAVDGVDALLVGPADLAASMGLLGQQNHPDVMAAVEVVIAAGRVTNTPVGVNAFDPETARRYAAAGAAYVLVGSDVTLLARASESLAKTYTGDDYSGDVPAAY
ncbi:HpcH/HpaI aldolase family protein [Leifsonia shinshuensis]|uniref:2-dehydro-3-deoxyglucarate aldolase n=1 Tax=Leifsonia shinshuensis TaxID=150026 RepID=A0A7G6YA77_9MICO|nr:aldolase/citrate lyase family protein [Leifsonia shinshuensis]QNE35392.1 2-dehydro-3-deoxyglucarate aldolase [Leifsonia shinshuensis]